MDSSVKTFIIRLFINSLYCLFYTFAQDLKLNYIAILVMNIKQLFSVIIIGWTFTNSVQAQSKLNGEIYTTDGFPITDAVAVLKDSLNHAMV